MHFYVHTKNFWTSTCMRPGPQSIPIPGIRSLTERSIKRSRELFLKHHLCNAQRTFEKCVKILTDWMYNLQTRSFVLPNCFYCIFFIKSKYGLLNVNGFSLINFISLNTNLTNFKLLNM